MRVEAAVALRRLAFGGDPAPLDLSRSLLAELSTLIRANYVRHLRDVEDADGHVVLAAGELVRSDVTLLAEWWRDNGGLLVESHREHAARHLTTLGVPT